MGVSYGAARLFLPRGALGAPAGTGIGTGVAKQLIGAELADIDPAITSRANDSVVVLNCYDALFRFEGWKRVNSLCQEYSYSTNKRTVTFRIRQGVKFHDGREVKASDVVYSMVRMLALKGPTSILWDGVVQPEKVKLVDEYRLSITTARPYGALLDSLAWMWIVNEQLVRRNYKDNDYGKAFLSTNDAGSGPFTIEVNRPGELIRLRRFADYWGGWPGRYLDAFEMQIVREPATRRLLMQQGEAHVIDLWALDVDGHEQLKSAGLADTFEGSRPSITNIMMHNQKPPTDNKHFRKACAYAFNYDANIKGLQKGHADYAYGPLPKGYDFYKSYQNTPNAYRRDLDRARFHLRESGFNPRDPRNTVLRFNARQGIPAHADLGLLLQSSLREIGINIDLLFSTLPEFRAKQFDITKGENFARISYSGLTKAPDGYCTALFHSDQWKDGGWFATMQWYKNTRVNTLLNVAKVSADPKIRQKLFEELQDIVFDDAPSIWIDQIRHITSTSKRLRGYVDLPLWATPIDYRVLAFRT
jgi:peptide/nickel transport system substrate-binding protein